MKNILVFPSGSEIGLEIHNSLKYSKECKLFGGSSVEDHGKFVYKNYIGNFPYISDDSFLDFLNNVIEKYDIDMVFPAHDDVLLKLSYLKNEIKAEVIVSPKETCNICRSKKLTYKFFKNEKFTPRLYNLEDINEKNINKYVEIDFPVFLKPDIGQGSKGVALAKKWQDLKYLLNENPDLVVVEYLPGKEYTIDCFTSKGNLLFCGKRERIRVKDGISVNAKTLVIDDETLKIAKKINELLEFHGAWFFQIKKDINGDYKLLEIAPRIAGTMALYRNNGINFPLLTLYSILGADVDILQNNNNLTIDRALINRFKQEIDYDTVYIDFDDTIILKENINTFLIMFLYQCVNNQKKIILITKHVHNIYNTLKQLRISKHLFDEIIHINKNEDKHRYIKDKKAIFIDDSFKERKEIFKKYNFPVFDLDAIESLIDWKM